MLVEYQVRRPLLEALGLKLEALFNECLAANGIRVHSVTHRVKEPESLERKLTNADGLDSLDSVTDLLGLRVITYFPDDVDRVAMVIQAETEVDGARSTDKRASLDPDRFGYLSLHYIARVDASRRDLPEYRRFAGVVFEVQIRSILQHAWAEIEHDLGYKAQVIPARARRQFSRLAGLLELGDDEFRRIRDDLAAYSKEAASAVVEAPETTPIDAETVIQFAASSKRVQRLDKVWAVAYGRDYDPLWTDDTGRRSKNLLAVGLRSIGEVDRALRTHETVLEEFMKGWAASTGPSTIKKIGLGHSLFFLGYLLAGISGDRERILQYLKEAGIAPSAVEREQLIGRILELVAAAARGPRKGT